MICILKSVYARALPGEAGALDAGDAGFDDDFDCLMTKCTVIPSLIL